MSSRAFKQLMPSLLDRLTDDQPRERTEALAAWSMSMHRYREAVLRDLRWLLNSTRQPADHPLYAYSEAPSSVLNYGIRDIAGLTVGAVSAAALETEIRQAILDFEPRILPSSLVVTVTSLLEAHQSGRMEVHIAGTLWAEPLPEYVELRSEFHLETGVVEVHDA